MKNYLVLISSILIFGLSSCKTKSKSQSTANKSNSSTSQQSTSTSTTQPTVYYTVTDQACALEMAFGSYGSGIDGGALDKVTALIDAKKLKYTSKNIGREGETRLCLPLTELNKKEKNELIEQLKKIAEQGQLVSLSIR